MFDLPWESSPIRRWTILQLIFLDYSVGFQWVELKRSAIRNSITNLLKIICDFLNNKYAILTCFWTTLSDVFSCCSRLATFETYWSFNRVTTKVIVLLTMILFNSPVEVSVLLWMPVNRGRWYLLQYPKCIGTKTRSRWSWFWQ